MYRHVYDRIHLCVITCDASCFAKKSDFMYVFSSDYLSSNPIEGYFGPASLDSIYDFSRLVESRLKATNKPIAIIATDDGQKITNTAFLLGAFLIIKMGQSTDEVMNCLQKAIEEIVVPYSDLSRPVQTFQLHLQDCLAALERACDIGWVDFGPDGFDLTEYRHLDSPLNAELHEIVPGRLIIMRGPRDLPGGALWRDVTKDDGRFRHRDFSPAHYADILAQLDVRAIVRCNAPAYDSAGFEAAGIAVVDLCCEDLAPPPVDVVAKFLAVVEGLPGAVAVHCGSGRGRSGTLVALYLMKHHGFTAREAIGWLRIVRPGWYAERSFLRFPCPSLVTAVSTLLLVIQATHCFWYAQLHFLQFPFPFVLLLPVLI